MTNQMRLVFRRTHNSVSKQDPEERLMDEIAGKFGFYPPLVHRHITGEISFELIEDMRRQLCPEASLLSSMINFIKYWPTPCIFLRAEMGYRRDEESNLAQQGFFFLDPPEAALRAVEVSANEKARQERFTIHENMRVPEKSVVSQVFFGDSLSGVANEDLSWWETSKGMRLPARTIRVKARRIAQSGEALIFPL
jgi:hypothetical protein